MELIVSLSAVVYILLLPLFIVVLTYKLLFSNSEKPSSQPPELPGTYPLIGSFLSFQAHKNDRLDWLTTLLRSSPASTVGARHPFGMGVHVITANPANVEHILKTNFSSYPKGPLSAAMLGDLLGGGIFNVDGDEWKFQRQISIHEFSTKSLRKYVETVVEKELSCRLLPVIEGAASVGKVLDLQEVLKRFAFDNICQIAFGYDPQCLLPSLPESPFADAFNAAIMTSEERFVTFCPLLWRVKRFLNVGSERKLKQHVSVVRDFALSIVRRKTHLGHTNKEPESEEEEEEESPDLLSRFIAAGHDDERFLTDIVISFLIAGRDTTSSALTWFFWLISQHPGVEQKILDEIKSVDVMSPNNITKTTTSNSFEETRKEMVYTQAALFESMRLYPPLPDDFKQAVQDDRWPDGTVVVAGTTVEYNIYAMGRMERIWGNDWSEFKPERWLKEREGRMGFVSKDPYSYPVFQAGPRICLGKEMAILQMKRIVDAVLKQYTIVPAAGERFEPVYEPHLTAEMEGGFPVKFVKRGDSVD